jgi:hypothetical protein
MRRTALLAGLGLVGAGVGAAGLVARARYARSRSALVDDLRSAATTTRRVYTAADLDGLPAPVQRYFEHVLTDGQPYVRVARMTQRGEFRIGDATAPWRPLEATEHATTDPPGFVWDARIELAPFVPVRVVDAYVNGHGVLRAKLFSAITVADADPGPELDEGELLRYLGEAVWYPTALLPWSGVEWEAVDDQSARATLTDRGTTASLVFEFEDGEVRRVRGERPYTRSDGTYDRVEWVGHWQDYVERDGMLIPADGSVEWHHPDDTVPYWRGRVTEVDYAYA